MKIESVDFFYLSMPVVTDAGDVDRELLGERRENGLFLGAFVGQIDR